MNNTLLCTIIEFVDAVHFMYSYYTHVHVLYMYLYCVVVLVNLVHDVHVYIISCFCSWLVWDCLSCPWARYATP